MTVHLLDPTSGGSKLWADLVRENKERKARMFAGAVEQKRANDIKAPANIIKDEPEPRRVRTLDEAIARFLAQEKAKKEAEERARKQIDALEQAVKKAVAELHAVEEQMALKYKILPSVSRHIIPTVAEHFQIPIVDFLSIRRTKAITLPRQIGMYLAKTMTLHSLPEVGRRFGRDHTTVLHAVRKITARMAVDDDFRATVEHLRDKISPPAMAAE